MDYRRRKGNYYSKQDGLETIVRVAHNCPCNYKIDEPNGSFLIQKTKVRGSKMSEGLTVALITLGGSGLGSLCGIVISNKLTTYRIEQLEKKVDKHNTVIERTYKIEEKQAVQDEQIKVANHRIDDLEERER